MIHVQGHHRRQAPSPSVSPAARIGPAIGGRPESPQLVFDDPVHYLLVVVVIGQATVDLSEREVRVLTLNFIGVPVVRQTVQGDFKDLGLRANQPRLAVGAARCGGSRFGRTWHAVPLGALATDRCIVLGAQEATKRTPAAYVGPAPCLAGASAHACYRAGRDHCRLETIPATWARFHLSAVFTLGSKPFRVSGRTGPHAGLFLFHPLSRLPQIVNFLVAAAYASAASEWANVCRYIR